MQTVENAALTPADLAQGDGYLGSGPVIAPLPRRRVAVLVAVGGGIGSVVRFIADAWMPPTLTPTLAAVPWSTLTVNLLGALLLGVLAGAQERNHALPLWVWPTFGIGLLGGFTTMSTLVLEWSAMIGSRFPLLALGYATLTLLSGLVLAIGGILLGGLLEDLRARRARERRTEEPR